MISTGSNFLCDATAGEQVKMTGPTGKVMLMPEEKADTDYIMVATGTGIAPYRGFIRRLFTETTPAGEAYKGTAWLFLGVANSDALLYDEEWQAAEWKSTSASGAPDNSSLSHFSAMTRPSWLGRAVRNEHHHAMEQASRRWR